MMFLMLLLLSHCAQWAGLKAILVAPAKTHLMNHVTLFLNLALLPMTLLYGLPPERLQMKEPTLGLQTLGKKNCGCCSESLTPAEAQSKSLLSHEIDWNQDADQSCPSQITNIATWIHHHTRHGSASTIINWTHNKGLYVSAAKVATECQTSNTGQKLVHWFRGTGGHVSQGVCQEL